MFDSSLSRNSLSAARSLLPKLANMRVMVRASPMWPSSSSPTTSSANVEPPALSSSSASESSPPMPTNMLVISKPVDMICSGYTDSVSSSTVFM